jgi:peptidoglycan/LPS O-acetylase OafA/YrhL
LIAISIFNHLTKDKPQLSLFLSDRIARIATPLIPVLCLVAAINALLDPGNWGQFGTNRGAYAFIGNALLLNDYPVLQGLSNKWNVTSYYVRSYNTAEPFWTIPIEFWIYVGVGLFAFVVLGREKIRLNFGLAALLISTPVIVWNSFAGGGKCLTLIWFVGAAFGGLWICLRRKLGTRLWPVGMVLLLFGVSALTGRILKAPFDPLELQTTVLMACILFGVSFLLEGLEERKSLRRLGIMVSSYSYSLYLVHNTVLVVAFEHSSQSHLTGYFVAIVSAHLVAIAVYWLFERHYRNVSIAIRPLVAMLCSPQSASSLGVHMPTPKPR